MDGEDTKIGSHAKKRHEAYVLGIMICYQKDWETPHLLFAEKSMGNKVWDKFVAITMGV